MNRGAPPSAGYTCSTSLFSGLGPSAAATQRPSGDTLNGKSIGVVVTFRVSRPSALLRKRKYDPFSFAVYTTSLSPLKNAKAVFVAVTRVGGVRPSSAANHKGLPPWLSGATKRTRRPSAEIA